MLIQEQKEGLVNMTEDLRQKEMRLKKELARVKAQNSADEER